MIGKNKKRPILPQTKILAQSQNYRLVQGFWYAGDYFKESYFQEEDPYRIIEHSYVEKREEKLTGEIQWVCYQNNPKNWATFYCKEMLFELYGAK